MRSRSNLAVRRVLSGAGRQSATAGYVAPQSGEPTKPSISVTADRILAHPALGASIHQQAHALVMTHRASPCAESPFASAQRWRTVQAAGAKYFRSEADHPGEDVLDDRVIAILRHWLAIHLATLDGFDSGQRFTALRTRPHLLAAMQPVIADGQLASCTVGTPGGRFSAFTANNDGSIVMDRLIAGCQDAGYEDARFLDDAAGRVCIPTDVMSISGMAQRLNLPRTQVSRIVSAAEAIGGLGWTGRPDRSPLWVSAGFRRAYHLAQAAKLAVIDAAFAECAGSTRDARVPIVLEAAEA